MRTLIDKISPSKLVLSPMAGISDSPFRKLCREMGSAISITEFVSTAHLFISHPGAIKLFRYEEAERPVVFQIFGNDPEIIVRGISRVLHLKPDGIDLNMGCSVKNVSGKGSGAGLLRCPEKSQTIIRRLIAETGLPISAKIRLGWDHDSLNYMDMTAMLEAEGVWAIAVHGRTRQMAYTGKADWERIGEIARARKIPIFGNGDVVTPADADEKIARYGVAGVYVGRGAIGNPWIFSRIDKASLGLKERLPVILRHIQDMKSFYGDRLAGVLMRKFLTQYLRDLPEWPLLKPRVYLFESADELSDFLAMSCGSAALSAGEPWRFEEGKTPVAS